jgi:ribonuclease HI
MQIEVFTDGSATVPSKPGGWAWVMVVDGVKHSEGSGYIPNASNNDMELEAAIQGLAVALKHTLGYTKDLKGEFLNDVTLCSDSQLVLGWADGSFRFKQESKMNKFKQLQFLVKRLNVKTKWIKGHSKHPQNDRCDFLANQARKQLPTEKVDKPTQIVDTKIGTKKNGIVCLWYKGVLKVIDLENGIVENYSREAHGKRGSAIEIREERDR